MATGHVSLDPQIQAVLDAVPPDAPSTREMGVEEARSDLERMAVAMCGNGEGVGWSVDRRAPGPGGEVPVRLYAPDVAGPLPVVVYLHGGGWAVGSLDSFDALCRRLANRTGALVVSVAYRLAPEHPFPAAVEDAETAVRWAHAHAPELGADPTRIAVAGDSAGANLATVIARRLRDAGGPELALQALMYPALDPTLASESCQALGEDYMLSRSDMAWFWELYLSGADPEHPDAAPARAAELSGLAPAYVLTAEYDPLRDEGEAYAAQLEAAGVATTLRRWPGAVHGFVRWLKVADAAGSALDEVAGALREALAPRASLPSPPA